MALIPGSASTTPKTGMAGELYLTIHTFLTALPFFQDGTDAELYCAALANAIATTVCAHIAANATVTVPALGLVAPPGTAGGPVTGSATGTIS